MNFLDKRLHVVSGKGGVGKSVVAAALALVASRHGKNTLLVELDTEDRLADLFGAKPIGDKIEPLRENISGLNLDPRTVLVDFFRSHIRVQAIYDRILDSRTFNYFYEAAPALKELVCLGKIHRLVHETAWWSSRPKWDVIVFDAPATGHGLGLLNVPEAASGILMGSVKTSALKVRDMFRDPAITALNVVTIPEEMPVNEAIMLHRQARDELRVPFGCLFLNSVFPEHFSEEDARALEASGDGVRRGIARAAFGAAGEDAGAALATAPRFATERGRALDPLPQRAPRADRPPPRSRSPTLHGPLRVRRGREDRRP